MLIVKEVWDQVCNPENQILTLAVANGRTLLL